MSAGTARAGRVDLDRVPVRHARGQAARRGRGRVRRRRDARVRPRHVAVVARPTGRGGRGPRPLGRGLSAVPRRDGPARPLRRRASATPSGSSTCCPSSARGVLVCCSSRTDERPRRRRSDGGAAARPGGARRADADCGSRTRPCRGGGFARTRTPGASSQQVDHPALGLCLDSFHVLSADNDPDRHRAGGRRQGLPRPARGRPPTEHGRAGVEPPLPDVPRPGRRSTSRASSAGSCRWATPGPIALEVFNDVYQQEDPRHAAIDAMRSMLALAEAVAARGSR